MPAPTVIFSVAEARAFGALQLASAVTYPDATIQAAEVDIRAEFEHILGYYPIPTTVSAEVYDGDGTSSLHLKRPEVTAVAAITTVATDGTTTAFTAGELTDLIVYGRGKLVRRAGSVFPRGEGNVRVTYTCGLATVPGDLKRAAMQVCVRRLIGTDAPFEMSGGTMDGVNWSLVVDPSRGRWYGWDQVDGVLNRYRRVMPGIA